MSVATPSPRATTSSGWFRGTADKSNKRTPVRYTEPMQTPHPDELSLSELERRLTTQAAIVAAETAGFLRLLAAFDRRNGWHGDGVRSCAHWMNWQLGTSTRTAREQLRVAHALEQLPQISAAFESGSVSYSRVRAITRIALPETEDHLLMLAKESTGAQLETIVRTYRLLDRQNDEDPPPPPAPELRRRREPDGRVAIILTVDEADAELVWKAIHAAKTSSADRPLSEQQADAMVAIADSYLAHGPTDRSGSDRTAVVMHADARRAFTSDGTRLDHTTSERVRCDARLSRNSPGVSAGLRRQLMQRHGGCIWPGCDARHHLHAHHVIHREHGGKTRLDNLVILCGHHHRVLHREGFSITRAADGSWHVLRSDGSAIPSQVTSKTVPRNRPAPINAGPTLITSNWKGEVLDTRLLDPIPVLRA